MLCPTGPGNITAASCPIVDVQKVGSVLTSSRLLAYECCNRICQNSISVAAEKLAFSNYDMKTLSNISILLDESAIIRDCMNIMLRWLATCPLVFLDITEISEECGDQVNNKTSCCNAMESYILACKRKGLLLNLQAVNCASLLGLKLQCANISSNVFSVCHKQQQDFSPQLTQKVVV
ncbi:uncharacterized GPI-anchored protein At1g61900-like [Coffea eugenioides]|uniref:uncharacterized GPI-anchored protein At1g61900-like n=1 Tax=Coffea eugenioides TaxID=49369 RepID=UPI000F605E8A|nr:uncharacterized GPI-anchored protein At1g61900-like [Coffea eugenioides]